VRWQIQEAKQRFSELVRRTLAEGPQTVTRNGEEVVVVIPASEFRRLQDPEPDFAEFLLDGPDFEALEFTRPETVARDVELEP
jgi:antitoxin Phd